MNESLEALRHEKDKTTNGMDFYFWIFDDERSYVSTHWHSAIEITYTLEGQIDVNVNGTTTTLGSGDIFLIDSAVAHSTKSLHGNKGILIQLPYPLLQKYIPDVDKLGFSIDTKSDDPIVKTKILQFTEVIKSMEVLFEINPPGGFIRFHSLMFELIYQLYHNFSYELPTEAIKNKDKTFSRLEDVLTYLDANYNKPITLSEIASVACFSEDYFCHFFKKNMGFSYTKYLNDLRLAKIYQDLLDTDLPLKVLLEKHGFTNYKLFRKMFFEAFGTTPGDYRKNHK